jgi:hypothetical protein
MTALVAAATACAVAAAAPPPATGPSIAAPAPLQADTLGRLYRSGRTFQEFLRAARHRRDTWTGNYEGASLDPAVLARARAVPGRWRLLVVADDSCGDSANTIPFVAALADSVPAIELRVVGSREGRGVTRAHRTADGRAATPTVVLLDEQDAEAGCFIERPLALQAWVLLNRPKYDDREFTDRKYEWYRADGGRETVREIVELLEAAALDTPRCQTKR